MYCIEHCIVIYGGGCPSAGWEKLSVRNFEKGEGQKNMGAWGDLKSSCHRYLPEGIPDPFQKKTSQKKMWL